jgi:hypothetical protein
MGILPESWIKAELILQPFQPLDSGFTHPHWSRLAHHRKKSQSARALKRITGRNDFMGGLNGRFLPVEPDRFDYAACHLLRRWRAE